MTRYPVLVRATVLLVISLAPAGYASARPTAEENGAAVREAAKHFQRGVVLYSEADYSGALVEFKRAYALAPNEVTLYNVGETQYQIRDYASALGTFERYLSITGPVDPHRSQVESNIKVLRSRVGQLNIVTVPAGAEVSVDDRVIGTTPFERPVVVGVGHLTVTASAAGRVPVTRYVDVAAEDTVSVTLELPSQSSAAGIARLRAAPAPAHVAGDVLAPSPIDEVRASPEGGSSNGPAWRTAGWIATGLFAVGATGFGLLARRESNELKATKQDAAAYPTTKNKLDHLANLTTTFSVVADSLAVAALVVGGITLYSSLGSHTEGSSTRVSLGPTSMRLEVTF